MKKITRAEAIKDMVFLILTCIMLFLEMAAAKRAQSSAERLEQRYESLYPADSLDDKVNEAIDGENKLDKADIDRRALLDVIKHTLKAARHLTNVIFCQSLFFLFFMLFILGVLGK